MIRTIAFVIFTALTAFGRQNAESADFPPELFFAMKAAEEAHDELEAADTRLAIHIKVLKFWLKPRISHWFSAKRREEHRRNTLTEFRRHLKFLSERSEAAAELAKKLVESHEAACRAYPIPEPGNADFDIRLAHRHASMQKYLNWRESLGKRLDQPRLPAEWKPTLRRAIMKIRDRKARNFHLAALDDEYAAKEFFSGK